jgi:hypothetical protein
MQRPASVTTFGILNIVFSVLGIISIIASTVMLSATNQSNNPVMAVMRDNPAYASWMKIATIMGIVACIVLLIAGIGLLLLKRWARKLSLGYAVYAIVAGILGSVMNYIYLVQPLMEEAARRQGPEAAGAMGGAIGGVLGGCIGLVYPILILIFLTRPKAVAAFQVPPPDQIA